MIYDVQSKKTCLFYQKFKKIKELREFVNYCRKKDLILHKRERIYPCERCFRRTDLLTAKRKIAGD